MDGVGLSAEKEGNAVMLAKLPNLRDISQHYPGAALQSAGLTVGVPWGEMGNSEVGHLAIGSGLVVYQNLPRINMAIRDGSFFKIPVWQKVLEHAKKNKSAIHLMGLVSNGGVHSHQDHLFALLELIAEQKFGGKVFIHMFTDGRDAPPQSAPLFLQELQKQIEKNNPSSPVGGFGGWKIASVSGRYYAMDRDNRWERVSLAFDAIVKCEGEKAKTADEAIHNSYAQKVTDEFIKPTVLEGAEGVKAGDAVIFFNFRSDRARQLTELFMKSKIKNLLFTSMTEYDKSFNVDVAFDAQVVEMPIAKVISNASKKQLHIAETEKYAHVTYFLNGGSEKEFLGEERILVPSPKVQSYDKKPEMSAYETTEIFLKALKENKYDFIVINFANGDMVGHTGNLEATIKGMEVVDECVGKIVKETIATKGAIIITADHGNCEEMINLETGQIDTEHSVNPVPFWFITPDNRYEEPIKTPVKVGVSGILPDVAPTVLEILNLPKPDEMTGSSLLKTINRQALP